MTSNSMCSGLRGTLLAVLVLLPALGAALLSPPVLSPVSTLFYDEVTDGDNESNTTDENFTTPVNWTAQLPIWNVGDSWTYSVILDAVELVEDTAELEGAELGFLYGDALMQITAIEEMEVDGVTTPTYNVLTTGNFIGSGQDFPAPVIGSVDGDLLVEYRLTEHYRVGDLALIGYEKHLVFTFEVNIPLTPAVDISDSTESSTYSPPLEFYDFPLSVNESWNMVTNHTSEYVGIGDIVPLPDEPEHFDEEWSFNINKTIDSSYPGCENSTEVWMLDDDDEPEEWRWWCPAVNQYSHRWTDNIALGNVNATMVLTAYTPATPNRVITVEINPNRSALNAEVDVNITVIDASGDPISGASGYLYLRDSRIVFTTDANGSDTVRLMVGNDMDDTPTAEDWATHGVVALLLSDQTVGVSTLTLEGSSIGGMLRLQAAELAVEATTIMSLLSSQFEEAVRY